MRKLLLLGAALIGSVSASANANVSVHVERSPAEQAGLVAGGHLEDFSDASPIKYASDFGGSGVTGLFDGFGAADGAATLTTGEATIKLDRKVKYFGYRAHGLDGNNTVELFSDGKSLGFFNLVDSRAKTGIVGTAMASEIEKMMSGPAFTYVNFFSDKAFDEIRFTQSSGSFSFDDVQIADVSAVPEPTTWALMILGFGAVGYAVRRGRRLKGVRFA